MPDTKATLRKDALAARMAAPEAARAAAAAALIDALTPFAGRPLAGYMPMRGEADPRPAMQAATQTGPVCVPVVIAKAQPLRFRSWQTTSQMEPGTFGALIPQDGAWIIPEVLIVPLVAFDKTGARLGYGGGFYDRTLHRLRACGPITAIGFALACQQAGHLPQEPTDQPLDMIVTENGPIVPAR